MKSFSEKLFTRINEAQFDFFPNNYDEARYGPLQFGVGQRLKRALRMISSKTGVYFRKALIQPDPEILSEWLSMLPDLEWFHQRLADDESRDLLVEIIAFRIMGHLAVQLPLGEKAAQKRNADVLSLADRQDQISEKGMYGFLNRFNLESLNYPISLYTKNPYFCFDVEQYVQRAGKIAVEDGDVVLDGGGVGAIPHYISPTKRGVQDGYILLNSFHPTLKYATKTMR